MTSITITAPELKTITRGLSSDWGPTLHTAARRIGAVVALVWALCSMASDRWQQLVAWAQQHQLHGLARLGLPGGNYPEIPDACPVAPTVLIVQRLAPVRTATNMLPPVDYPRLVHISDPMLRAVRMVRLEGRSQRLAASLCGVSRSSLQRALKA